MLTVKIVRLAIKLQGVQSLVLWYRQSIRFAAIVGDISIVDAKFGRILKVFKIQSSKIYVMNDEYHGRKSICDQIYDKYKMYDFV